MAVATSPYADKTDEQKAMTEMVRQFADEQILPNAEHYDGADEYPGPIVEQMKELGLFGVTRLRPALPRPAATADSGQRDQGDGRARPRDALGRRHGSERRRGMAARQSS